MHELCTRVITDSPSLQRHSSSPYCGSTAARNFDIHGFALDVQAIFGNPRIMLPENGIGNGGAIPGNDMERLSSINLFAKSVEEIKQLRIDGPGFVDVMIAHDVIDSSQGIREISPAEPVDSFECFSRVGIIEGEEFLGGFSTARLC
jgi:hypothetical protein